MRHSIGSEQRPCKNIFEAIKILEPHNPILKAEFSVGSVTRTQNFTSVVLDDGKIVNIAKTPSAYFYRGENAIYSSCKASLYRIENPIERMVAEIKAIEFIRFLKSLPEIQEFEKQNYYVAYAALAQHYGFSTNMLDLTDDIIAAVFFAIFRLDPITLKMDYMREGIGRIRYIKAKTLMQDLRFIPIGLQPLARPAAQSGYGLYTEEKDDFASISSSIYFYQDEEMNRKLAGGIPDAENVFMPPERQYDYVANTIKNFDVLDSGAVNDYCKTKHIKYDETLRMLKGKYEIVDAPLVIKEMLASFPKAGEPIVN